MRLLISATACLAVAFGCSAGEAQNPPPAPAQAHPAALSSRIDPKAQELLDRTIQALGGAAFLGFKTMTTHGRAFSIADGTTEGLVTFDSVTEYPDKRRLAYGSGKKKPIVLINDGDHAWEIDRMGVTSQPPEQARLWKITNFYSLENVLRLRIREPGTLIQAAGVDFVENLPAAVVDIFDAHNVHVRLYLNQHSFLPVEISYRVQNPKTRDWDEYADAYSDYQTFQGVQTPLHIARSVNGERVGETFRNSVQYNQVYPPAYFQPPGG